MIEYEDGATVRIEFVATGEAKVGASSVISTARKVAKTEQELIVYVGENGSYHAFPWRHILRYSVIGTPVTPVTRQEEVTEVTARLAAVLERYQSMPVEPGGFVRFPREYTVHAPAWTLAAELAAALTPREGS